MSKFCENVINNKDFEILKNHIGKYADDLIEDSNCKVILDVKITEFNDDNIKKLIIKYLNNENKNVTRTTHIEKKKVKNNILKRVHDRKDIKPFGRAITENNSPTIDKEIQIQKTIPNIKINNENSKKKKLESKKIGPKQKYKPPTVTSSMNTNKKINVYVPPTRTPNNNRIIPSNKVKIINIDSDTTIDDIKDLCYEFGNVINCYIPTFNFGNKKGKNKGFAIVKFNTGLERDKCIENINNMKYNSMILKAEKYN